MVVGSCKNGSFETRAFTPLLMLDFVLFIEMDILVFMYVLLVDIYRIMSPIDGMMM